MPELLVRNSCMMIQDYDLGDCKELEKIFMVPNRITFSYDIFGMYYSIQSRTLYIPRGLDIWWVKKCLGITKHRVIPPNDYESTGDILVKTKPRDEEQEEALKFMIGLDQYDRNAYEPQLSVNLNTGKGKTYCSIATIAYMRIKSIIITGANTLLKQWQSNIKEYTNLTDKDILFISGSPMMNMILNDKSQKAKEAKIFLCTHGTIRSFCDQYGWKKLDKVFKKLGIGMKFIDEAHTNFTNMLMIDFFSNVYKTYYVTATPERSSWKENRIYQLSLKNVPGINLFNQELDPHTDYIAIKWNSKPTMKDIKFCSNKFYGLDRNKYVDYITKNENFYFVMRIVMQLYLKCGGRGLFYIGTNEGILRVYQWICNNYPELLGDVGIYTSLLNQQDKLKEKGKKLILSTTKSAGLGEHIEHLKMTVVIAEPFKSEVLTRQTLGRTRDDKTLYIELIDLGFRQINKFYLYKKPTLKKYAKSVSETVIDQYELENRAADIEEKRDDKIKGKKQGLIFNDERFFDHNGHIIV